MKLDLDGTQVMQFFALLHSWRLLADGERARMKGEIRNFELEKVPASQACVLALFRNRQGRRIDYIIVIGWQARRRTVI